MKTSLFKRSMALVLGATAAVALGLSSASAQTVILDGTTVIRIENLEDEERGQDEIFAVLIRASDP